MIIATVCSGVSSIWSWPTPTVFPTTSWGQRSRRASRSASPPGPVTLVGDDEPVPLAQRPEFAAIYAEPDPHRKIARFVALGMVLQERLAPLWSIVTQLEGFLRDDLEVQQARDQLWTLNSPEVRRLLVDGRGWSTEEYETWLSRVLADTLLGGSRS